MRNDDTSPTANAELIGYLRRLAAVPDHAPLPEPRASEASRILSEWKWQTRTGASLLGFAARSRLVRESYLKAPTERFWINLEGFLEVVTSGEVADLAVAVHTLVEAAVVLVRWWPDAAGTPNTEAWRASVMAHATSLATELRDSTPTEALGRLLRSVIDAGSDDATTDVLAVAWRDLCRHSLRHVLAIPVLSEDGLVVSAGRGHTVEDLLDGHRKDFGAYVLSRPAGASRLFESLWRDSPPEIVCKVFSWAAHPHGRITAAFYKLLREKIVQRYRVDGANADDLTQAASLRLHEDGLLVLDAPLGWSPEKVLSYVLRSVDGGRLNSREVPSPNGELPEPSSLETPGWRAKESDRVAEIIDARTILGRGDLATLLRFVVEYEGVTLETAVSGTLDVGRTFGDAIEAARDETRTRIEAEIARAGAKKPNRLRLSLLWEVTDALRKQSPAQAGFVGTLRALADRFEANSKVIGDVVKEWLDGGGTPDRLGALRQQLIEADVTVRLRNRYAQESSRAQQTSAFANTKRAPQP